MGKMTEFLVNDKPATKISAVRLYDGHTGGKQASFYDCEGDEVWVPHSVSIYNESEEYILIQDWYFKKLEDEGKL